MKNWNFICFEIKSFHNDYNYTLHKVQKIHVISRMSENSFLPFTMVICEIFFTLKDLGNANKVIQK